MSDKIIISPPPIWRSITEIRKSTLDYIIHRKSGLVKSIRTPWRKVDDSVLGGLEWGSLIIVGARPGVGKTAFVDQLTTEAHLNNPDQDFAVLRFQFEMSDKMTGARELTSVMKMDLKQLFSAEGVPSLSEDDIKKIASYHSSKSGEQIYSIDKVRNPKQFREDVIAFYKFVKKPIIVTLDHSLLVKKDASDLTQLDTLYNLINEVVFLKKVIPDSIFIILTQMNRNIELLERRKDKSIGNYPNSSDIYGADSLMQSADLVIALNRPDQLGIKVYGDSGYIVSPGMIVAHLIKNRYGELKMLFLKEDLKHFRILEADVPPRK